MAWTCTSVHSTLAQGKVIIHLFPIFSVLLKWEVISETEINFVSEQSEIKTDLHHFIKYSEQLLINSKI